MYSKGVSWIDDCRIPTIDNLNGGGYNTKGTSKKNLNDATSYATKVIESDFIQPQGRFPANILVSDDMLNDGVVSKSEGRKIYENEDININNNVYNDGWKRQKSDIKDKGTNSRYYDIDKWFDKIIE